MSRTTMRKASSDRSSTMSSAFPCRAKRAVWTRRLRVPVWIRRWRASARWLSRSVVELGVSKASAAELHECATQIMKQHITQKEEDGSGEKVREIDVPAWVWSWYRTKLKTFRNSLSRGDERGRDILRTSSRHLFNAGLN